MLQKKIVYEGLCCCGITEGVLARARCIDSMPFLAMAIVRNEGCRRALARCERNLGNCVFAYKRTVYAYSNFLENFVLEERQDVRKALGMIQLIREEETEGKRYHILIEILNEGFRTTKRMIQKQEKISGAFLERDMDRKIPVNAVIPEMMVQLVFAEEYGVPIERDVPFYRVMKRMEEHLNGWIQEEGEWEASEEGKELYCRFCKEHENVGNWFAGSWSLDNANELNEVIMILNQFHLKEQILNKICLKEKEAEILCSLDEKMNWDEYRKKLLIATLCKYIHEIHILYTSMFRENEKQQREERILCRKMELLEQEKRQLYKELWAMQNFQKEAEKEKRKEMCCLLQ